MKTNRWVSGILLLVVGATATATVFLHHNNVKLRAQASGLRLKNEATNQLREESRRMHELVARNERNEIDAKEALHLELLRAQVETRELEEQVRARSARRAAAAAALATNHNPETGLARLEDFKNVGRSTPVAAVQTLVWAALKGDESALTAALAVTGPAREKAEALLAALPESARVKYPTPESIASLVVTGTILDAEAAQLLSTNYIDAQHAVVTVRGSESENTQQLPLELGAGGWVILVPPKMIDKLAKRIGPPSAESAPSK